MTDTPDSEYIYRKVIAKAWSDPSFKARLMAEPHAALAEMGMDPREDVSIEVVEDTSDTIHLVIPNSPAGALTEEEMEALGGGCWTVTAPTVNC